MFSLGNCTYDCVQSEHVQCSLAINKNSFQQVVAEGNNFFLLGSGVKPKALEVVSSLLLWLLSLSLWRLRFPA